MSAASYDIESLKELPLIDAAIKAIIDSKYHKMKNVPHFRDLFFAMGVPGTEILEAWRAAQNLVNDAFKYGDNHIRENFSNKVYEKMMEEHPGFSNASYAKVLSYGCYLAK